ncbi:hypothetical protein GCM10023322_16080 [Rugosimonospora acidiphila]|uniref:DUF1254 domain-containing protein n=1 Tax=Rugosimonospora acidiphila TaxID=556531 RepID=A0ABP9RPF4_9ACTN
MKTNWWRRNRWGTLLLVPALVAAFYSPVKDLYSSYWQGMPHRAVTGSPGGWVGFAGSRMRLEQLAVAHGLQDFLGEPIVIPAGTQAWQATIDFDTPKVSLIEDCRVYLEAADGQTFSAGAPELKGLDSPVDYCTPPDLDTKSGTFQTVAVFLLPRDARPVALQVTLTTRMPAYARLTPP